MDVTWRSNLIMTNLQLAFLLVALFFIWKMDDDTKSRTFPASCNALVSKVLFHY